MVRMLNGARLFFVAKIMRVGSLIFCGVALASCSRLTGSSPLPSGVSNDQSAVQPLTDNGYKFLYSFQGGKDGQQPFSGPTALDGTLYGTTGDGGSGCYPSECGTVFKVSTSGEEHVLYSFKGTNGQRPMAALVTVNGTLYGTTTVGSKPPCGGSSDECGTVFAMSTTGKERLLHRFTSPSDGAHHMHRCSL